MAVRDRVTIGVPIYRGERFLEETLHAIQRQTHIAFDVIMSIDSPDPVCEAICAKFLGDQRFKLVVQPQRLGWVAQINWLLGQVTNDFWYYHQQDDLTDPTYLEALIGHAHRYPSAALVYCDIEPIGRVSGEIFSAPSVLGASPFARVMTMLQEHFPAFAFRGLTRASALAQAGPVPVNAVDNFGVDISWLTGVARCGELHRVPQTLYRKRYHDSNTESRWWKQQKPQQLTCWAHHCVDMLAQAMQVPGSPQQSRLLWQAAISRLTAPEPAGHFMKVDGLTPEDRWTLLDTFLDRAQFSHPENVPALLDADWRDIRDWTAAAFWIPRSEPVDIVAFGPEIVAGRPFNVQPDGGSALWLRTSRLVPPKTAIRLGGTTLETVINGTTLAAAVPSQITAQAGECPLVLVGPDGKVWSNTVIVPVIELKTTPNA